MCSCKQVGCKCSFHLGLQPEGCLAQCHTNSYRKVSGFIAVIWICHCLRGHNHLWVIFRNFLKSTNKIFLIVFWPLAFKALRKTSRFDQAQASFHVVQVTQTGQHRIKLPQVGSLGPERLSWAAMKGGQNLFLSSVLGCCTESFGRYRHIQDFLHRAQSKWKDLLLRQSSSCFLTDPCQSVIAQTVGIKSAQQCSPNVQFFQKRLTRHNLQQPQGTINL